ncbi:PorT family protein [Hymenobacter oligotrophus]|uniref:PorT family protein n=1 Tax=Hymenobacter oligotrophus TaxID=2319843 RepID=A0A3B7R4U1_9BACT|nr:porin family protein [Hymenobacter oligotrophus]AYA38350.1 PorT family protein [Hymenobacter oligotrophus]
MKKFFALALALAGTTAAFAQGQTGLGIGVKVGGTYSNVSGDNVQQLTGPGYSSDLGDSKLGYNAGLSFNLPVSSDGFFSIAPEILYNRKGYEIQSEQTTGLPSGVSKMEMEQQRVLHYIDVPVLARINAGGLFFEAGPQVSYLFGSKAKTQMTTKYSNGTKDKVEDNSGFRDYTGISRDEAYKSDLSQFDISGVAGVGYMIPDAGVSLTLRYARGFNSLIDSKDADNEPKAFNNAFTLQLGYLLPVGR